MVVADKREADVHSIAPGASIPDDAPPTDPDPMSQGQLPPATDGLYYDFNNMDATSVQDMANNQVRISCASCARAGSVADSTMPESCQWTALTA